ncbi:MAG: hypothetical protein PVJ89_14180 [Planctomycetota bacterium]|jgi:hypothetical protein
MTPSPTVDRGAEATLGWRALALPLAAAAAVRAALILAFDGTELAGDERAYLLLGERWRTEGAYDGIWAPGYPMLVAALGWVAGEGAASALRWVQALLGLWVVACVGRLGAAVGGPRAGRAAAWLGALHLPLAGLSALLFSETLFLALFTPALLVLASSTRDRGSPDAHPARDLALAGALLGLSALVRESALLMLPLLGVWAARVRAPGPPIPGPGGPSPALLLVGAACLVIAPWTLRNAAVHGTFVPIATSTGGSVHVGVNAHDVNYDLAGLGEDPARAPGSLRAALRGEAPEPWTAATDGAPAARARTNVRRGLSFAAEHPAFFLRSRAVEVVDLLSPLSYPVRSVRLADPGAPLGRPALRVAFALLSILMVPALLLLALRGWCAVTVAAPHRALLAVVCAGTLASALVNGLTRYRAPALPLLMAFAAVALVTRGGAVAPGRRRVAVVLAGLLVLAWIPSLEPVRATVWALR